MKTFKTMSIKSLIKQLKLIDKELSVKGNKNTQVMLSCDGEGNGYGTVTSSSFSFQDGYLLIYPQDEYCDL